MNKTLAIVLVAIALRADFTPNYRGATQTTWYYGSRTVFVGRYVKDTVHPPTFTDNTSGNTIAETWDFQGCTAADLAGKLRFTCAGMQLDNGVEIIGFHSTGVLPTGVIGWYQATTGYTNAKGQKVWQPNKSYWIVNRTAASSNRGTNGSFEIAETPGGTALNYVDAGTGSHRFSFAGHRHALSLSAPAVRPIVCDAATDQCHLTDAVGAPITHSYGAEDNIVFITGKGGARPTEAVLGALGRHCIIPIGGDSINFRLRRYGSSSLICPTGGIAPSNTRVVSCVNTTVECTILSGGANVGNYMGVKFSNVTAGTYPVADLGPLGDVLWTSPPLEGGSFRVSKVPGESRLDMATSFTATATYTEDDINFSGTAPYYIQHTTPFTLYIRSLSMSDGTSYGCSDDGGIPNDYPVGTRFTWRNNSDMGGTVAINSVLNNNRFGTINSAGSGEGTIIAKVPATASPGQREIAVTMDESSNGNGTFVAAKCEKFVLNLVDIDSSMPATSGAITSIPALDTTQFFTFMTQTASGGWGGSFNGRANFIGCPPPRDTYANVKNNYMGGNNYLSQATHSTLTAGINSSTLTLPVTSTVMPDGSSKYLPNSIVRIDQENINICTVGATSLTVCAAGRGYPNPVTGATTAASHSAAAEVLGPYGRQSMGNQTDYDRAHFYGGDAASYAVADMTGQTDFNNCGNFISRYNGNLLIDTPAVLACCAYTGMRGLYQGWSRMRNDPDRGMTSRVGLARAMDLGNSRNGDNRDVMMREMATAIDRVMMNYLVTRKHDPDLPIMMNSLIGWGYEHAVDSDLPTFGNVFMMALWIGNMIDYYHNYHPDPRIPVVVSMMADRTWNNYYNPVTHRITYSEYTAASGRCYNTCHPQETDAILNSMIAPMMWARWRLTGDDLWRQRGDDMFNHMYDTAGTPYSPKMFNESMFWMTRGIKWRLGTATPW